MAQLIVRKVDDTLVQALKRRATEHGRSMEAEHREILRAALEGPGHSRSFKEFLQEMPDAGDDADFARPPDFGRKLAL